MNVDADDADENGGEESSPRRRDVPRASASKIPCTFTTEEGGPLNPSPEPAENVRVTNPLTVALTSSLEKNRRETRANRPRGVWFLDRGLHFRLVGKQFALFASSAASRRTRRALIGVRELRAIRGSGKDTSIAGVKRLRAPAPRGISAHVPDLRQRTNRQRCRPSPPPPPSAPSSRARRSPSPPRRCALRLPTRGGAFAGTHRFPTAFVRANPRDAPRRRPRAVAR